MIVGSLLGIGRRWANSLYHGDNRQRPQPLAGASDPACQDRVIEIDAGPDKNLGFPMER
jgi:hypothetical protein